MNNNKLVLGWREWVSLPELGISAIKAKIDTGARTSTLHAFEVQEIVEDDKSRVAFKIHPNQRDTDTVIECKADILDQRVVSDSGGHKESRWVISTQLAIGSFSWPIEMTLTARDDMLFRMLLGRTAINGRAVVDSALSYSVGKKSRKSRRRAIL
jgi:hypothetical protein